MLEEVLITKVEMIIPEEAAIGAERAGMRTLQNQMALGIDECGFLASRSAP